MSFVLDKASEGYDERLSLFNVPPVQTAIQEIYVKDYRPLGQLSRGCTLEFDVPNNTSDYIIMNEISLLLTLKLYDDKNVVVTVANDVGLINYPAATIFRQLDLSIQQQIISSSVGANYPYKAMLDTLLNTGEHDQSSWLVLGGYEKDTAGSLDSFEPATTSNSGLDNRYDKTKEGKPATFKTKLYSDVLEQKRLLLNGLPMNFKLYPSAEKFCLMYKINL